MTQLFVYLSYMILIFCILKFYKYNSNYTLLTISITIGIYLINTLLPMTKERFTDTDSYITDIGNTCDNNISECNKCLKNRQCQSNVCSNSKCKDVLDNDEHCENDTNCRSHHCNASIGGMDTAYKKCESTKKNGDSCRHDNECNDYDPETNTYKDNKKCQGGECHHK